jgi:pyruvate formate lyase activating enzyme
MGEVTKDIPIFDESNGGVTFSGGEPLSQHDFLKAMLIACKSKEIHSAVDTSGYAAKTGVESIIPYASLFLYDLKLANDEEHRKYTGVSNKPILENLDLKSNLGRRL